MTTRMKIILGAAGGGLLLVLIIGFFIVRSVGHSARLAPFRKHMDEYLTENHGGQGGFRAYKSGKILPIDEKAKDVDSIYFDLPADVVAQTPEEVGAVVRIKWGSQVVRTYKGGRTVSQDFCMVSIYDFPSGYSVEDNVRFEDRKPSLSGVPDDPDRRDLRTRMIDYFKSLKPGVPLSDLHPTRPTR